MYWEWKNEIQLTVWVDFLFILIFQNYKRSISFSLGEISLPKITGERNFITMNLFDKYLLFPVFSKAWDTKMKIKKKKLQIASIKKFIRSIYIMCYYYYNYYYWPKFISLKFVYINKRKSESVCVCVKLCVRLHNFQCRASTKKFIYE